MQIITSANTIYKVIKYTNLFKYNLTQLSHGLWQKATGMGIPQELSCA